MKLESRILRAINRLPPTRAEIAPPALLARCPACQGAAHRETWDTWTPGAGWVRVHALRCARETPGPGRCGAVTETAREPLPDRAAPRAPELHRATWRAPMKRAHEERHHRAGLVADQEGPAPAA